jgi:hypothetical protein
LHRFFNLIDALGVIGHRGKMIRRITLLLLASATLLSTGELRAGQQIWRDVSAQARGLTNGIRHFEADYTALQIQLNDVPHESLGDRSRTIKLPLPDGSLASFIIVESPIMEPALAARYPEIKTFKVYGIDDPLASGRVDITPRGFHAMLFTANGRLFIDPDHTTPRADQYLSRYRGGQPSQEFTCEIHEPEFETEPDPIVGAKAAARISGQLIVYDIAVAATAEYVAAHGGSVDLTYFGIFTIINRVSSIYERDLGIRLSLVSDKQLIDSGGGVFSNYDATSMLAQNQAWIDAKLGNANYDIGHVFSTGPGGLAFLGSTCSNSIKAQGVSGTSGQNPLGASFYIDYVAHEIGHQFNAEHSFNGTTNSCGSGRNAATAFEPGSGSSIMGYAGICELENLQPYSDATFHAGSIAQIDSFTRSAGSCYELLATSTGNQDPTIAAIGNNVIPANTPFVLGRTATANDPNLDMLSYQWDQMDAGCPTDAASFGTDNGSNALFRSYFPRNEESKRNFPALGTQVRGRFDKAEVLPCHNRDLDFRLTVRDGNGGQAVEDVRVSVDKSTGPFRITSIDPGPIFSGTAFAVNWDVANTDLPPINCLNVEFDLISFSDNYRNYSIHPLDAVSNLNDGSEIVTFNPDPAIFAIPETATHPLSRVRIKCSDNIFYDISDADLTVEATIFPAEKLSDTNIKAYSFENPDLAKATVARACGAVVECAAPQVKSSGSKGGGGALDYLWLLMMTGMIAVIKLCRRYGLQ